jgi:hypothetical protein
VKRPPLRKLPRCECGHAKNKHVDGKGICFVQGCFRCWEYRRKKGTA